MTIRQAYLRAVGYLRAYSSDSPEFDAAQLVEAVTGVSRGRLPLEGQEDITPTQWKKLRALTDRRAQKYPLQYLLGQWDFYGLTFAVGEGVLIPRPDTEILVETGLQLLAGIDHPVIYDLCSGSGCIAAAVASQRPDAIVYAVEISADAFPYLLKNIRPFPGVKPVQADIFEVVPQLPSCHLILSNPPYLSDNEMDRLQTEVTYEPKLGKTDWPFTAASLGLIGRSCSPKGTLPLRWATGRADRWRASCGKRDGGISKKQWITTASSGLSLPRYSHKLLLRGRYCHRYREENVCQRKR